MHIYIHDTFIPNMSEGIYNGSTNTNTLENYGITKLCQDTVGDWLTNIGFKYDYVVRNYYVYGQEKKDTIRYIWKFIDRYILLYRRMFRCIRMVDEESDQYKGQKK